MYSSIVNYLILLALTYLVLALIRNIVTLLELFRMRRSILKGRSPITIPFTVFTTRPVNEAVRAQLANRAASLRGSSVVHGLKLPLQLCPTPHAHVQLKLSNPTTVFPTETASPVFPPKNNVSDHDSLSSRREKSASQLLHSGGCGSQEAACHGSGSAMKNGTLLPSDTHSRRVCHFSCDASEHRAGRPLGEAGGRHCKRGGSSAVAPWMARSQFSLHFRLKTAVRVKALWLRRIRAKKKLGEKVRKKYPLTFSELHSIADSLTVEETNPSTPATEGDSESCNLATYLRCAYLFGADSADIMRAVTVDTTCTFGSGSHSYHCYYTAEDEEKCVQSRAQLDWHNRPWLGSRFGGGDHIPLMSSSVACHDDSVTHTSLPLQRQNQRAMFNSTTSVGDMLCSHRSLDSYSMMLEQARSCGRSMKSNVVTETFVDVSERMHVTNESSTCERGGQEESKDAEINEMTSSTDSYEARKTTESTDDHRFATAVSAAASVLSAPSSSSSWKETSSNDKANTLDLSNSQGATLCTEPQPMTGVASGTDSASVFAAPAEETEITSTQTEGATTMRDPPNDTHTSAGHVPEVSENANVTKPSLRILTGRLQESVDILPTEPLQDPTVPMLYEGSISIAPDILKLDTKAIASTATASTSLPESLQVDVVDLVLSTIQTCCLENSTSASGGEVNVVSGRGGGGGEGGSDAYGERVAMKRKTWGGTSGQDSEHKEQQNDTNVACRQPLAFALMLYRQKPRGKRCTVRGKRQAASKSKQLETELFICVYSTTNSMENTASPPLRAGTSRGPPRQESFSPHGSTNTNVYREMGSTYSSSTAEEMQNFSRQRRRGLPTPEHLPAFMEDSRSGRGAVMPLTLQYVRIGNDLYAVTEVLDRTFVQYREERALLGRDGGTESSFDVSGTATGEKAAVGKVGRLSSYSVGAASYSLASSPQMGVRHQMVRMCWLCLRTEANIVLLPCGHFLLCRACADNLTHCCICHSVIHATVLLHEGTTSETEV
ncbi:hypothetical protein TraAM80_04795 [Trypanosoma rangeli]|uniref:RING-type domain-containing protein n=1 Tax=Trypanosoma rangeli TaxID=5698 RepID=A0A3R7KN45_TRYRA|nr:uncharacterized protein TraAM80_04795 [Trypanosoma rangeli]RNF05026.1 hypothetical protein TraAM80_04795 [Trypanosoma rangeli]|eukprot:RNF05026.1 hypothetical protein TraAM80_04795 [Trypanosoma rangeli]